MKFFNILVVCFLVLFHVTHSSNSNTLLIEKAAFIANSVFKEFITAVAWRQDESDDVGDFIKQFRGCVVLTPVRDNDDNEIIKEFNRNKSFTQTVFIAAEVGESESFMELLYQDLVSAIRIIIILTKSATHSELSELMEIAWKNDVADILVVSSDTEDVALTTYFPYNNGKCDDFTPVYLDHNTVDWFPKKFVNFHGCKIRTTLLQMLPYSQLNFKNGTLESIAGIDGNVLNLLFKILNASMSVFTVIDHGGIGTVINGTPTGSLADLANKQADIMLPALYMSHLRYPYVQFSHAFESVNMLWFGPKRHKIGEWLRILQPFMSDITPALFTSATVFVVVTMIVRRFGLHRSYSRYSVLFQTFIVFLGMEVNFETKSWLTNSLFIMWIWFCMVVRIAFQGDLVHGLQKTILESPLRTFETAVKQVDGYGGIDTLRDFFSGRFYNEYQVLPFKNVTHYLKEIAAGKRYLLLTEMLLGLDAEPNSQVLYDDPVTEIPVCFYMRPGWSPITEVDSLILRIIETGFVQKITKHYFWEWAKRVDSNKDREARPLTLGTMIGCFYGLGALSLVCILVLFVEIIYHRMKQNPKHNSLVKIK